MSDFQKRLDALLERVASRKQRFLTERNLQKVESEILRTLFYSWYGYKEHHPWGINARPPYPENLPLPLKSSQKGEDVREAIEKVLEKPEYRNFLRKLLRAVHKELKDIDE